MLYQGTSFHTRLRRVIVFCSLVLCGLEIPAARAIPAGSALPGGGGDEPKIVDISPAGQVSDWLLDEASGRVFACLYDAAKVIEYDPATGAMVREFAVGEKPRQLVVKGDKLVASVESAASLYVIDLRTNQVDGRVQIGGTGLKGLSCSKANNSWVYVISNTNAGMGWMGGEIFQVDVARRAVRKSARIQGWRLSYASDVNLSPDGRWALVDGRRTGTSPTGLSLMRVDEDAMTFAQDAYEHNSFGQVLAGPSGRFWTVGNSLYSQDIRTRLREFKGDVVAIHPTLDLVVGLGSGVGPGAGRFVRPGDGSGPRVLSFQTFSGPDFLREVRLGDANPPAAAAAGPRGFRAPPAPTDNMLYADDPELRFDARNDRLFVGHGNSAHVVDLRSLGLKTSPLLLLTVPGSQDLGVGQALKLPLSLSDPGLITGTTFALEGAPTGMSIAAGQVVWTPAATDVGQHKVTLKATRAASSDQTTIVVNVTRPAVALGGQVLGMVVDPTGTRALVQVLVPLDPNQNRQGGIPGTNGQPQELVLVDTAGFKVIARRRFDDPLSAFALTEKAAFAAPQGVARIHRLKLADLSDDGRTFTNGPVGRLELLPGGDLAVVTQSQGYPQSGVQRFDGQNLRAAPELNLTGYGFDPYNYNARQGMVYPVDGGTAMGPLVLDPVTNAPCFITGAPGLPAVVSDAPRNFVPGFGGEQAGGLWNRHVVGNQLMGPSNTQIAMLGAGTSILMKSQPLAVTAGFDAGGQQTPQQQQRLRTLQLDFRELVEGKRREPLVVMQAPVDPQRGYSGYNGMEERVQLQEVSGRLFVGAEGRLFVVDVPADRVRDLPVPLHFVQRLDPLVVPLKGVATFKPAAAGGAGRKTFELPGGAEGVSADPSTGVLSIDTQAVWRAYLKQLSSGQLQLPQTQPGQPQGAQDAAGLVADFGARFRQLLGKEAGGAFPLAVHFRLTAKDEENQRADLAGYVIVLAPAQPAVAAVAALEKSRLAPAGGAGNWPPGALRPTTQPYSPGTGGQNNAALLRRIDELERQNAQLQSQVDLLKELVGRGQPGPAAGRPRPAPASQPGF